MRPHHHCRADSCWQERHYGCFHRHAAHNHCPAGHRWSLLLDNYLDTDTQKPPCPVHTGTKPTQTPGPSHPPSAEWHHAFIDAPITIIIDAITHLSAHDLGACFFAPIDGQSIAIGKANSHRVKTHAFLERIRSPHWVGYIGYCTLRSSMGRCSNRTPRRRPCRNHYPPVTNFSVGGGIIDTHGGWPICSTGDDSRFTQVGVIAITKESPNPAKSSSVCRRTVVVESITAPYGVGGIIHGVIAHKT